MGGFRQVARLVIRFRMPTRNRIHQGPSEESPSRPWAIGVFEVDPGETEETVADALAGGLTATVDTAVAYGNEEGGGSGPLRAPRAWTATRCGVTTKVWMEDYEARRTAARVADRSARRKLGVNRIDPAAAALGPPTDSL